MYIHKYANYKDNPMIKISTIDAYMLLKEAGINKPTVEQINMVKEGGWFQRAFGHIGNAYRKASSGWRGIVSRGLGGARKRLIDSGFDASGDISKGLNILKSKADDVIKRNTGKSKFVKDQITMDRQFSNAGMHEKAKSLWNVDYQPWSKDTANNMNKNINQYKSDAFNLERNRFKDRFKQHANNDFYQTLSGKRMNKIDAMEALHPSQRVRENISNYKKRLAKSKRVEGLKEKLIDRKKAKDALMDKAVSTATGGAAGSNNSPGGNSTSNNSTLWGDLKVDYAKRPDLYKGLGVGAGAMYVADSRGNGGRSPW